MKNETQTLEEAIKEVLLGEAYKLRSRRDPDLTDQLLKTKAGKALVKVAKNFKQPLDIDDTKAYTYFFTKNSRMVLKKLITIGKLLKKSGGIFYAGDDLSKLEMPRADIFPNVGGTTTVKFPDGLIKVMYTDTTIEVNITE